MYRTFLLVLFAIISFDIQAQKWDKNEVDDFTGQQVRSTKYEKVATTRTDLIRFAVGHIDDNYYLGVYLSSGTMGRRDCKNEDTNIIFRFLDGDTHTLKPTDEIECGGEITIYYPLNNDDLNLLKTKDIAKFRIYFTGGYRDYSVKKGDYFKRTIPFFN